MRPAFPLSLLFVTALLLTASSARSADLEVGSAAPPFSLPGSDGKQHALADHAGKRGVVLAWFPKAFTPG
jgi:peroxiredoxin Q/BCP